MIGNFRRHVQTLLGSRINSNYYAIDILSAGLSEGKRPYALISQLSRSSPLIQGGQFGPELTTMQLTLAERDLDDLEEMTLLLRPLIGFHGDLGGTPVSRVERQSEVGPFFDPEEKMYRWIITYTIQSTPPEATSTVVAPTAPDPLITFTATAVGGSVRLDWQRGDDMAAVVISRGDTELTTITDTSISTYVDRNLVEGQRYIYTAVHRENELDSTELTAEVVVPFQPPNPPILFTATPDGTSIDFAWAGSNLPAGTVAIIRQGDAFNSATEIHRGPASAQSFTPSTVFIRGVTYTFYLFFEVNSLTSGHLVSSATIPLPRPDAPTGFTGSIVNGRVQLTWDIPDNLPFNAAISLMRGSVTLEEAEDEFLIEDEPYIDFINLVSNAGQTITYTLRFHYNDGASDPVTTNVMIPFLTPAAPTSFSATLGEGNQVLLSWTRPSSVSANTIIVLRRGTSTLEGFDDETTSPTNTYTDSVDRQANQGRTITYRLQYFRNNLLSPTVSASVMIPFIAPAAPTGFMATATGSNQISLLWSRPTSVPASASVVLRRGSTTLTGIPNAGTTSFLDSINYDDNEGQSFTYTIHFEANGLSSSTVTTSVTIPQTNPEVVSDFTATINNLNVILRWSTPPGAGAQATYTIRRGTETIQENIPRTAGNQMYVDMNRPRGIAQNYEIIYSEDGVDSPVATASVTIPHLPTPAPTGFVSTVTGRTITLNWQRPASLPDGARTTIERDGDSVAVYSSLTDATSFIDTVEFGTTYTYRITFTANDIESDEVTATATTGIPQVPIVSATLTGVNVALSWTNPAGLPDGTIITIQRPIGGNVNSPVLITSYSDPQDLTRGQSYTWNVLYTINGVAGTPTTSNSITVPHIAPSPAPTFGVQASLFVATTAVLSWTRPTGLSSNALTIITRDGTEIYNSDSTALLYNDVGLSRGETYEYSLIFRDNDLDSTAVTASLSIPHIAPLAPANLQASVSGTSVSLSWTLPAGTTSAATARIVRGTTEIAAAVTGTSYTDSGLSAGDYTYTVSLTENSLTGPTASVSATISGTVPTFPAGPVVQSNFPSTTNRAVLSSGIRLASDTSRPRDQGGATCPAEWQVGDLVGAQFRNNSAQTHFIFFSGSDLANADLLDGTRTIRITMTSSGGAAFSIEGTAFTFQTGTRQNEVVMASSTIRLGAQDLNLAPAISLMRAETWGADSTVTVEVV